MTAPRTAPSSPGEPAPSTSSAGPAAPASHPTAPTPGAPLGPTVAGRRSEDVRRWAASGALALTGRAGGPPLGPPSRLVAAVDAAGAGLVHGDPLRLLGERAALLGLGRRSPRTCGGSGRLLRGRDGWFALSLARPDDVDLLAAWLEDDRFALAAPAGPRPHPVAGPGPDGSARRARAGEDHAAEGRDAIPSAGAVAADRWAALAGALADRATVELDERAGLLGLPGAAVGAAGALDPVVRRRGDARRPPSTPDRAVVVDLSSLWAGPLCGQLLAAHGADVVKVESVTRPDGARAGDSAFFDLLNGSKRSVALDLGTAAGRAALRSLVERADVVIEASRPRALAQLGLDGDLLVEAGWSGVWVSITGYGRDDPAAGRVAFGDDAAAAGGLVAWEDGEPRFCADAVADPLTGMTAAAECVRALAEGGSWLLDVRMAGVAAAAAGPTLDVPPGVEAAPPSARRPVSSARPLGADNATVLTGLGPT